MLACRLHHVDSSFSFTNLQELEETQSILQSVQKEKYAIVQSKAILESRLESTKEAESIATAQVESLSSQVQDLHSNLSIERTNKEVSDRSVKELESKLRLISVEKNEMEKEMKSRAVLQDDIDKMRRELQMIRETENERIKKSKLMEAELQETRNALDTAQSAVTKSEATVRTLQIALEGLKRENQSLLTQAANKQNETPAKEVMEWEEASEGIEIQMNKATPRVSNIDNINALGAEDSNGSLSDHVTKIPLLAVLRRTPDSSSRHLSYAESTPSFSDNKEDSPQIEMEQPECSLCFRPPRPNGKMKSCQCGRDDCHKWAHASCLLYRKSVSSCISHPGTPAPPLPTILCDGIWCNRNYVMRE